MIRHFLLYARLLGHFPMKATRVGILRSRGQLIYYHRRTKNVGLNNFHPILNFVEEIELYVSLIAKSKATSASA